MPDLHATVVYCLADKTLLRGVSLPEGSTLADAVRASGLLNDRPELTENRLDLGVYNHVKTADTPVRDGDRIEIYRPLTVDPKEARRIRVEVKRRRLGR